MKRVRWKKMISMLLASALLFGSVSELTASAVNPNEQVNVELVEDAPVSVGDVVSDNEAETAVSEGDVSESDAVVDVSEGDVSEGDVSEGDVSEGDISEGDVSEGDVSEGDVSENDANGSNRIEQEYQYVTFRAQGKEIVYSIPESEDVTIISGVSATDIYRVNEAESKELVFEASVRVGDKIEIPEALQNIIVQKSERVFVEGRWVYSYGLELSELDTTEANPVCVALMASQESVSVEIEGNANVSGVDEYGYALLGSKVSVEVVEPGYVLAKLTKDEKGNDVYTAMELGYDNCYVFDAQEGVRFFVVDPEQVDFAVINASSRKAKITGAAGLKLNGLASSAQGYNEIVLNFTAVKNGSDGTETENVYYEVKVTALAEEGETLPAGSSTTPKYYYIPKVADTNTQSKSIKVNNGDLSAPTAATYEFAVRMVLIDKAVVVPGEDTALAEPLAVNLTKNTITKKFSTKNLYYEDKLGFTKKNTKIYAGQKDVLAGVVKYSKKASYLHDLTAVVYDSRGEVSNDITCTFKNDNDELYVSASKWIAPGKYKVVVYASIGEAKTAGSPQSGTMYQSNTSFTLTVQEGIYFIDTDQIVKEVGVNSKNVSFSVVPVGYTYYTSKKAAKQKFTYELKSVEFAEDGSYKVIDPTDKVAQYVSVNSKGKVTINKSYYVDEDVEKNYIAVVIDAVDYPGNTATATALIQIVGMVSVPTTIYLADANGSRLGTSIYPYQAEGASVIVLDQAGNVMNDKVTITPADNKKKNSAAYVEQDVKDGSAHLYVRKCTTVKIKAVTKDGTKKSKTLSVKISAPRCSDTYYSISSITHKGISASDITTEKGLVNYKAPKGAVIRMRLGCKFNGTVYYNREWFDWDYSVTGATMKFDGEYILLTPTAKKSKIEFWDKSRPYSPWYVEFVNNNWGTTYEKAPKITLKSGKIYSNKYTNAVNLDQGGVPDQVLEYQYNYGSYNRVTVTSMSKNAPYLYVSDFDAQKRVFKLSTSAGNDLKPGSYKYTIAFYNDDVLMCMPATITVKVNKAPKVKITASYTLDRAKTNEVVLKCSTKDFTPDFDSKLMNANVGGKANDFTKYFELAYTTNATGEKMPVIRFKSTVTDEEKALLKGKVMTGYVKYSYYYGYSSIENETAKISIKVK